MQDWLLLLLFLAIAVFLAVPLDGWQAFWQKARSLHQGLPFLGTLRYNKRKNVR